jgi:hypothetical protein
MFNAMVPTQPEWIIKRASVQGHSAISDKKFLATLASHVGDYNPNDLRQASAALKKAERLMTTSEARERTP